MVKNRLALLCTVCSLLLLCSCGQKQTEVTQDIFAMDTIMTLTAYGDGAQEAVSAAILRINALDRLLSTTNEKSEIYAINHADGTPIAVSADTLSLIDAALSLCASTGGTLDISTYPIVAAWGFTTDSYQIPEDAALSALLEQVDYTRVQLDKAASTVTIPPDMEIDLGAVAKGYTGDTVMALLSEAGISSAIISLGGNVQALGSRPDGSAWNVGVTDPENPEEYFGIVSVTDAAVITSGGYQRYFVGEDGETYWHIIDPVTGAPARSGLISVTIVCPSGVTGDGLSTALFIMGLEDAGNYWRTHGGFEAILVTDSGEIWITAGLEDSFTLTDDYQDKTVQVIAP